MAVVLFHCLVVFTVFKWEQKSNMTLYNKGSCDKSYVYHVIHHVCAHTQVWSSR